MSLARRSAPPIGVAGPGLLAFLGAVLVGVMLVGAALFGVAVAARRLAGALASDAAREDELTAWADTRE